MKSEILFDFLVEDRVGSLGVLDIYSKFRDIVNVLRNLGIPKTAIADKIWLILDRIDKNVPDLLTGVNAVLDIFGLDKLDTLPVTAQAVDAQAFKPLRSLVIRRLKSRLKELGKTDDEIDAAIAVFEAENDRPFLDWLMNGGFEKLLEMILKIIALF